MPALKLKNIVTRDC